MESRQLTFIHHTISGESYSMLCSLELGNVTILSLILMLKCHNNRYQREIFQYRNIACSIYYVNNIIILRFIALKHAKSIITEFHP